MHSPANDAYVIPTGIDFITSESVYMHPTIVIAVKILGINNVKPCAPLAKLLAAVPNITAIDKIIYAVKFPTIKITLYFGNLVAPVSW